MYGEYGRFDVANLIIYRLLGVRVSFFWYEQEMKINPYTKIKLSATTSISTNGDSVFTFGFVGPISQSFSYGIYSISPRAEQLAMKIDDIIQKGSIVVKSDFSRIGIIVCATECKGKYSNFTGSIGIIIDLPNNNQYRGQECYEYEQSRNIDPEVRKAFGLGALALGGILLAKIIKGGIGAILGGPVGAAVGFCT